MVLTKKDILEIAKKQLAIDLACNSSDFDNIFNKVVSYKKLKGSRAFIEEDCFFSLATFGKGTVISCNEKITKWSKIFFKDYNGINCFEYPIMRKIDKELSKYNQSLDIVYEVYLPYINYEIEINTELEVKLFEKDEIVKLYKNKRFTNALVYDTKSLRPDVLAMVAYENGEIIGIAAAGKDCEKLWQIGIDVLQGYRRKGVAKTLVHLLTKEILDRGIIPYYVTWGANITSRNVAQRCGYFPAWVEMNSISKR